MREALPRDLTTDEQRTAWAIAKANEIGERAKDVAKGAPTKKNVTLENAIKRFFENESSSLRPGTVRVYQAATTRMLAWAADRGLDLGDELRGEHLADLRAHLVNKPRRGSKKGGKRGARAEAKRGRAPDTINVDLRALKTIFDSLRRLGLLPLVTKDAISDNLKLLPSPRPVVNYLKPAELVKLIDAASRHDLDMFDLTRDEKARGLTKGETPKHEPILPYLATVLLTGMRADEARSLRWSAVDLAEPPAGFITLGPEDTKTKHGRKIDLIVSPILHKLLASMRLRAGAAAYVFGEAIDEDEEAIFYSTRRRLFASYGAPRFTWKQLRVTCGTFLANAPGIFGAASAYREARQLGHSVAVAEKHYLGVVHVDAAAKTLEAAMGIEEKLRKALGLNVASKARGVSEGV